MILMYRLAHVVSGPIVNKYQNIMLAPLFKEAYSNPESANQDCSGRQIL